MPALARLPSGPHGFVAMAAFLGVFPLDEDRDPRPAVSDGDRQSVDGGAAGAPMLAPLAWAPPPRRLIFPKGPFEHEKPFHFAADGQNIGEAASAFRRGFEKGGADEGAGEEPAPEVRRCLRGDPRWGGSSLGEIKGGADSFRSGRRRSWIHPP